jgi:hypothetical protein
MGNTTDRPLSWSELVDRPIALARTALCDYLEQQKMKVPSGLIRQSLNIARTRMIDVYGSRFHRVIGEIEAAMKMKAIALTYLYKKSKLTHYAGVVEGFKGDRAIVVLSNPSDSIDIIEAEFSKAELLQQGVFERGRFHFWTFLEDSEPAYKIEAVPPLPISVEREAEIDALLADLLPDAELDEADGCD